MAREVGSLDRGAFLQRGAAAAAGALVLPSLLAADAEAAPRRLSAGSKTLVYATRDTPSTFDNDQADDDLTETINLACYAGGITRYNVKSGIVGPSSSWDVLAQGRKGLNPGLAESIEVSADQRVYTFHLRTDAKSAAGNPLTADDVVWTFQRYFALKAQGKFFANVMAVKSPSAVQALDAHTVRFTLPKPNPIFLKVDAARAESGLFDSVDAKAHATSSDPWAKAYLAAHTAGFDAYTVESVVKGQKLILAQNPGYYGPKPFFEQVVWSAVPSADSRLALLSRGDADIASDLSATQIKKAAKTPNVVVTKTKSNKNSVMILNVNYGPLKDPRVRLAIAEAVPYSEIISSVYSGNADYLKSPIPAMFPDSTSEFWKFSKDGNPGKAKKILADANASGISFGLNYDPAQVDQSLIAPILRSALKDIGITLQLKPSTTAVWVDKLFKHTEGSSLVAPNPVVADPAYSLFTFFSTGQNPNWAGYSNKKFDAIVAQLQTEIHPAKRAALARTAQKMWAADNPWVLLAAPQWVLAHRSDIKNIVWNTYDLTDFYHLTRG